jgi:hypothetical protein
MKKKTQEVETQEVQEVETQVENVPMVTLNQMIIGSQIMKDNIASLNQYASIKAIVVVRSNSIQAKKDLARAGDWWDMETETNLGPILTCSVLAMKYMAKVSLKKEKKFLDSLILPPTVRWTDNEDLLEFEEQYSHDENKYKYEKGSDLLIYVPGLQQYRHLFMKGALNSSVDGILTSCVNSPSMSLLELTAHKKGSDDREWYAIVPKWIKDFLEPLRALDKVLDNFFKVIDRDREDEVEIESESDKKKKAR